jgi:hypothetical protein
MPIRTAHDHPTYDASVQQAPQQSVPPSVKNVYDRDPLLIPQLFEDALPPWYRRRSGIMLVGLISACGLTVVAAVAHFGIGGTAERVGRVGTGLLRTFANIAGH